MLFVNPWSGGGKAAKVGLAEEAAQRGIRTVELRRGDDLEQLVARRRCRRRRRACRGGRGRHPGHRRHRRGPHGLPYACIPAGTRNHFALDLGVDRDDVVGALDAFVDGGEHLVDLGEVNGRVFVNNVSMGLYAEAVQSKGYRDAKIRTLLDTVPAVLGPTGSELDLRWVSPDGAAHASAATILVSNNPYRLGHVVGSGTRPRIDTGSSVSPSCPPAARTARQPPSASLLRQWSTSEFEVDSAQPGPAGHRRRGGRARPAGPLPDTSPHAARADLPPASGGVALGDAARPRPRRRARAGRDRRRSAADSAICGG